MFFAVVCIVVLWFVYVFVPETQGRSLEDMHALFTQVARAQQQHARSGLVARCCTPAITGDVPTLGLAARLGGDEADASGIELQVAGQRS